MQVTLRDAPFDPWQELRDYCAVALVDRLDLGAQSVFVGRMRDINEGTSIKEMFLEHYPGMTERCLSLLTEQALKSTAGAEALIVHRVGRVAPGEPIVLVSVWSGHRAAALSACREIIEQIKHTAPFWKRELTATGPRWVASNTAGTLPHD